MIVHHLIEQGYKPFRWTPNGLTPCSNPLDFSTMREGGIDVRLIKGESIVIYGLHEQGKPPTLISPRPKGINTDDEMNRFLAKHTDEEIFNSLRL
jgi:hypothetical protein